MEWPPEEVVAREQGDGEEKGGGGWKGREEN